MKTHELKTVNPHFTDAWNGKKLFEIRKDDRGFQDGDILWLREYIPNTLHDVQNDCLILIDDNPYTGRELICHVIYILPAGVFEGLEPNYCCMGIKILQQRLVKKNEVKLSRTD